jgi:hypothetical protein
MSTESSGPDLSSTELSDLTNQTLGPVQAKVKEFNLKAAGAAFNFVKRNLGTFTEPFFRVGMGERYYSPETHGAGLIFWIACAGAGLLPSQFVSVLGFVIIQLELRSFYSIFHGHVLNVCAVLAGLLMARLQKKLGGQNFELIKKYRETGEPYHTRSRGVLRWGGSGYFVALPIIVFLLIFNLPAAVLFIIGLAFNSKLKSEQQAAIMSRYQDAMDADIENKFLEGAALGEFPAKLSYLYEPIDTNMNPLVRQQVAAALVGKPVLGVARPPSRKSDADKPPASPSKPISQSERKSEFRAEALLNAEKTSEPKMDSLIVSAAEAVRSDINKIFTATHMSREKFEKLMKLGFAFRRFFIAGILIVIGLIVAVKLFHRTKPDAKPPVVVAVAVPQSPNYAITPPVVTLPIQDQVQQAAPPTVVPVQDQVQQAAPIAIATPQITRAQWLNKISTALDGNSNAVVQFLSTAKSDFAKLRMLRSGLSDSDDAKYLPTYDGLVRKYNQLADEQVAFVNSSQTYQASLPAAANLEEKFGSLTNTLDGLKQSRQTLLDSLQSACDKLSRLN